MIKFSLKYVKDDNDIIVTTYYIPFIKDHNFRRVKIKEYEFVHSVTSIKNLHG